MAVGGQPKALGIPGEEHTINSDGFFALKTQPRKAAIVGAGYIAVELAGVLNGLGTDTSLFVRGERALRRFDTTVSTHLDATMKKSGVKINPHSELARVDKQPDGTLTLTLKDGSVQTGYDCVIVATGREPRTKGLGLSAAEAQIAPDGTILVDEYQNTTANGVYALGDVCGKVELTPMAIAAGRRLADRYLLFTERACMFVKCL